MKRVLFIVVVLAGLLPRLGGLLHGLDDGDIYAPRATQRLIRAEIPPAPQ
jgi:hypothetical protein